MNDIEEIMTKARPAAESMLPKAEQEFLDAQAALGRAWMRVSKLRFLATGEDQQQKLTLTWIMPLAPQSGGIE